MIDQVRVLGILPARKGSKGVPGKNTRSLLGKPLIKWAADALASSKVITKKICSTDDENIAQIAIQSGLEVPWLRPKILALDNTLVVDVIANVLRTLYSEGEYSYAYVVLVQATSPTVTSKDIDNALQIAIDNDADTVITGFNSGEKHPVRMFRIDKNNSIQWLENTSQRMARRQELDSVFIRTGLVYIVKSEIILNRNNLYGDKIFAYIIPEDRAINIDTEEDFELAEKALKNNLALSRF
jgi:CMP-N,N'-diacetyllegionaminic acid synthase